MIFVGNSPISFKNIKNIKALKPDKLADLFRKCEIYITGAKNEACSNSLVEALHCGLPSVVINNASNSELVKNGGELFNTYEGCIKQISSVREVLSQNSSLI